MPEEVLITGGGVAACCCASLLSKAGYQVFVQSVERRGSPMLMLTDQTARLLRDVFDGDDYLQDGIRITRRVVAWGSDAAVVDLPHSGVVISENTLLDRLWTRLDLQPGCCKQVNHWNVFCSKHALPLVSQHEFGSRMATANSVILSESAAHGSCWVEAVKSGWLFLLPAGDGRGSLISVGSAPDILVEESRLVSGQIKRLGDTSGVFAAYPRIVTPSCGQRWIACGSAAIAFDPIAGEGAGHAVRQGILASAVIRATPDVGNQFELLAHYTNRVLAGFLRHLRESANFYRTVSGNWWHAEFEQMRRGILWAENELLWHSTTNFRLLGFELRRMSE